MESFPPFLTIVEALHKRDLRPCVASGEVSEIEPGLRLVSPPTKGRDTPLESRLDLRDDPLGGVTRS